MTTSDAASGGPIRVERWPTEIPLLILVVLASLFVWLLLAFSIVGLVYVLLIGVFLFAVHLLLVTHIRGSAVRLGPEQLPELYERVEELTRRAGLASVPEAYLMEAGGSLNAFATRFFRSRMIVLYSDLLDACGDDHGARDMIIGHELGHIRAGHLSFAWLLAPGLFMPFLGSAYSRAREYTCDRYGAALCGDLDGAKHGLTILAAGGAHAGRVNLVSFVAQSKDLDTGWMTLGKWLSGYPPLCERVAAIDPALKPPGWVAVRGPMRAALLLGALVAVPSLAGFLTVAVLLPRMERLLELPAAESPIDSVFGGDAEAATRSVWSEFDDLAPVIRGLRQRRTGELSMDEILAAWEDRYPSEPLPGDPFDGLYYGYYETDEGFTLWSVGPDGEVSTADDLVRTYDWIAE
ncbi:MAG: M48 family metallopeptidase [Thermoanaerobaculia bacterium]|nr:M48 family metallopeptidase [Thermoanaerobaculia bacterium]